MGGHQISNRQLSESKLPVYFGAYAIIGAIL